jgi:hypothetical protein
MLVMLVLRKRRKKEGGKEGGSLFISPICVVITECLKLGYF